MIRGTGGGYRALQGISIRGGTARGVTALDRDLAVTPLAATGEAPAIRGPGMRSAHRRRETKAAVGRGASTFILV